MPRSLDPVGERLPHLAGAEPRVEELLDQGRRVVAAEAAAIDEDRVHEQKSLIRCAAHSAWISEPGMPHTFSV